MTKLKLLGAAALLAATIATPAMAQQWTNDVTIIATRSSGFWPGEVAAGVVGGAVGAAGAIATAPFRNRDSYAYYGGRPMTTAMPIPSNDRRACARLRHSTRRDLYGPRRTLAPVLRGERHVRANHAELNRGEGKCGTTLHPGPGLA